MAGVTHQLRCAKLIPGDRGSLPCSCGAEKATWILRPYTGAVHNHGPAEGAGLDCPEYTIAGKLMGACMSGYAHLRDGGDEEPSVRPATVPSLTSEFPEALVHEVRTTSSTGGQKGVKQARFDLIPPEALALVAEHYGRGAEKYEVHNWRRGFEWSKSYAALQRHAHAFWAGEDLDPETESPHLAAVVFHALTLLTFMQEQRSFDDRFISNTTPQGATE